MSSEQQLGKKRHLLSVTNTRKAYIPIYFLNIVLVVSIFYLKWKGIDINDYALIGAGIFLFGSLKMTEIHRLSNRYHIDDMHLIHIKGIFNKISRSLDFFAISDLDVSQTAWQRLLGFGDVNVRLFSKDSTSTVKNINNPHRFADILKERMIWCRRNIARKDGRI